MATTIVWRYSLDPYWERSLEKMQQTKIIPLNWIQQVVVCGHDWDVTEIIFSWLIVIHFDERKNSGFDKKYICVYKKSIIHSSGFCDLSKMMINAFNWTADKVSILRTNDWLVTKVTSLAPTLLKSKDQLRQGHKITKIYYVIKCPQSLVEMLK